MFGTTLREPKFSEPQSHFCDRERVAQVFKGRSVAIVGSGPGVLENKAGFIDSHDVVVRVNNYRIVLPSTGKRTDVFYSFFGASIRKNAEALRADGVKLCMAKCPNAKIAESAWHAARNKMNGVDFRYIYRDRAGWWFCDTYVPTLDEFMAQFQMLGNHVPTTGFSAILDVLSYKPASVYLTGFDFFASGVHNVTEKWRPGDPSDPIRHLPELEAAWVKENAARFTMDDALKRRLGL